jgi:hypothetical protein
MIDKSTPLFVRRTPSERGRALECEVVGPKDSFGGCVSRHIRQHTPPPLSPKESFGQRGEPHWPALKICLLYYFSIAKYVKS